MGLDMEMRIRILQRNMFKRNASRSQLGDNSVFSIKESNAVTLFLSLTRNISSDDDEFKPDTLIYDNEGPGFRRFFLALPLPHSRFIWTRVTRVGRNSRKAMNTVTIQDQFTGVEEEERLKPTHLINDMKSTVDLKMYRTEDIDKFLDSSSSNRLSIMDKVGAEQTSNQITDVEASNQHCEV